MRRFILPRYLLGSLKEHPLISAGSRARILRAFTPRGMPFFDTYEEIYKRINIEPEEVFTWTPLFDDFKEQTRLIFRLLTTEQSRNVFGEKSNEMRILIRRLDNILKNKDLVPPAAMPLIRQLVLLYTEAIPIVAMDRDVFLQGRKLGGFIPWLFFRIMSKKEEGVERLRKEDPELYEKNIEVKRLRKKLDKQIQRNIQELGLEVKQKPIMGRLENLGIDPKTGDTFVFTTDGDLKTIEDYKTERKQEERAIRHLSRVFPTDMEAGRKYSDEAIEASDRPLQYVALTDDKVKSSALTRIYPVKEIDGLEVVAEGRFKGYVVEDLVNYKGRLIEGTAYDFDPKVGRPVPMETRNPDGTLNIRVNREPYVTLTPNGRLLLAVPRTKSSKLGAGFTPQRNEIYELSKAIHSLEMIKKTGRSQYYFEPKDFAALRDILGSMALSTAAMKAVKDYFSEQAKHELATKDENLQYYQTDTIGGFRSGKSLYRKQRQAMAWADSRDMSGIIALGTGVGKCVAENTLVSTNKGLVPIRDISPGVLAEDSLVPVSGWSVLVDGKEKPVKNFYYGGLKPTIRVCTRRGYTIEGSLVHPLLVRTPDGKENWIQTPELHAGNFLCVERKEGSFALEDPEVQVPKAEELQQRSKNSGVFFTNGHLRVFDVPSQMTPDMGRLLGYIVSEGWTNNRSYFSISQCPIHNPETRADLEHLLKDLLRWESGDQKDIVVRSVFLREYLFRMGVGMGLAKDKCIPPIILQSTRETCRQFLRALIDAEGYVAPNTDKNHIEFSTASEQLGREVQVLLLKFGIVCSRHPKKVSGYEHTYWRITITGEDAITYQQQIGFISARKIEASVDVPSNRNSNLDVVPYMAGLVGDLFDAILERSGHTISSLRRHLGGTSLDCTVRHIRVGRRNPTYSFLKQFLALASDFGCEGEHTFKAISQIVERNLFFDPVESLQEAEAVVMDIEVDDPEHSFVGNGLINHNTSASIGLIQKMRRDGRLEGGKNVLFVSPNKLVGNFPKEVRVFIEDADGFMDDVDTLSYGQLYSQLSKNPRFADEYAAIFFDEAQVMKTINKTTKAIMGINNPHKVLLTASPMNKTPLEVFVLAAIANNEKINTREERKVFNAKHRAFRKRFTDEVGGRTVGLKSDPLTAQDFRIWVRQNLYFADKRDVEEIQLPGLKKETSVVTMDPDIEYQYREAASEVEAVLRGMAGKWKLRSLTDTDPRIERAKIQFKRIFSLLFKLANMPDEVVPGARNPKMELAESIIKDKINGRSILFTDSPDMAQYTTKRLSRQFPGKLHVCGLSDRIEIWQDGQVIKTYTKKVYRDQEGRKHKAVEWQVVILNTVVKPNNEILTATLTKTYALGQNLQTFDTVIHLDRDDWNAEIMNQRTARVWRTGQQSNVEEHILDAVYENKRDERDETLDRIVAHLQELEGEIFDRVVVESQTEALGAAFYGMKRMPASFFTVNRKYLELSLSPYLARIGKEDL